MKITHTIILATLSLSSCLACTNEYAHPISGNQMFAGYFVIPDETFHFDTAEINARFVILNTTIKEGSADYKTWSDVSANLLQIGSVDSAIQILRLLLVEHPNEYNLLINLGTAYELTDKLDSSLHYMTVAYSLNPEANFGSEWIHLKVLEAKISNRAYPGLIENYPIINLDALLQRAGDHNNSAIKRINQEFYHQITTRLPFAQKPDEVLANLLQTLSKFNKQVGKFKNALLTQSYALAYQSSSYPFKMPQPSNILGELSSSFKWLVGSKSSDKTEEDVPVKSDTTQTQDNAVNQADYAKSRRSPNYNSKRSDKDKAAKYKYLHLLIGRTLATCMTLALLISENQHRHSE